MIGGLGRGTLIQFISSSQVYGAIINYRKIDKTVVPTFTAGYQVLVLCKAIEKSEREERWGEVPPNSIRVKPTPK